MKLSSHALGAVVGSALGGGVGSIVGAAKPNLLGIKPGGGGPTETTTTTNNSPWGPQQPYLLQGFSQAQGLLNNSPSWSPDFSAATQAGLQRQTQLGSQGWAGRAPAMNFVNDTLNGNGLNQGVIQSQYNQLAPSINSSFARAGRTGSGLQAQALGEAFGNVVANNYQQGQQNKFQAAGLLPQFQNMDYQDANAMLNAGNIQDQQNQARAMENWQKLQQYMQTISGNYGGTSVMTQPIYRNQTAGLLGGALSGAATGASVSGGNPYGALIGAGLGAYAGSR